MNIEKSDFGSYDGKDVHLYTLANDKGMEISITNYGGTVTSLNIPDKEGKVEDVVLGFDTLAGYRDKDYLSENPFFGALIGRFGNRIANGKFVLDGKEYHLAKNNGPNHLHGGVNGFDKVVWDAEAFQTDDEVGVKLIYVSSHMEEGYPGTLTVTVTYTLTQENELKISYHATTDKKTIVNLTNHSYFNLTGNFKSNILDHVVVIYAEKYVPVDDTQIPTGGLSNVEGTPFDFKSPFKVGLRIAEENEQLEFCKGYDHCWVPDGEPGHLRSIATVHEPRSGRFLEVYTTEPGVQFYTGNFLNGKLTGKLGVDYKKNYGLCLETQHFPDSPNRPNFPSVELHPGELYETETIYKFSVKPGETRNFA